MYININGVVRGVAQPGRVLAWGARGRRFDSCHPDHKNLNRRDCDGFFLADQFLPESFLLWLLFTFATLGIDRGPLCVNMLGVFAFRIG